MYRVEQRSESKFETVRLILHLHCFTGRLLEHSGSKFAPVIEFTPERENFQPGMIP